MLRLAQRHVVGMEFFGLVERMAESLLMLCATLDLDVPEETPFINRSEGRRRRDELDAAILGRIEETSAYDIRLYEFAAPVFEERWATWVSRIARETWPSWLADVLRARCRQRLCATVGTPPERVRIHFQESVNGWGWYAWDPLEDGTSFRWAGPTAELDVRIDTGRPLRLLFEAANMLDPNELRNLRVSANGHPLNAAFHATEKPPWTNVEARIPASAVANADGLVRLRFEAPNPKRPRDVIADSDDNRLLGFAVSWLELTPD